MNESKNETMKFWTVLTIILLAVAVTVTLIDLGIKAAILAESNSMKLAMEEWEVRNGQKVHRRTDERNSPNGAFNGDLPGDVLATDNAGMEARDAVDRIADAIPPRPRNRPKSRPSDGN